MNTYNPSDFKDMMFPFHSVAGDVLEAFPKLKLYPEFCVPIQDRDKIIKYIGFAYDKGSPMMKFDDIVQRKMEAAAQAGFTFNGDRFDEEVEKIFRCKNAAVNLMIIRFCRIMNSRSFSLLVASNETLNETIQNLMTYVPKGDVLDDSKTKMGLLKQARELVKETDLLQKAILNDDAKLLNEMMYIVTENDKINLTPEDFSLLKWEPPIINAEGHKEQIPTETTVAKAG